MKRTGIKRKTGLKRRSKPRAKSNSWYRRKTIEIFMARFRGRPCAVCGTTQGTCGHHLISKQRCPCHIVTPQNIIELCPSHHMFSNDMAAHSKNSLAVQRFMNWLWSHHPEKHMWMAEHEHDSRKLRWKELYVAMGGELK